MKKYKSLVLAVIGLLCSISVSAHDFKVDGIYYNITSETDKTVEVTYRGDDSNEYSGSVTIPETVTYNGNIYTVTRIGDFTFSNCTRLTSVEIPNSVTSIGIFTFSDCISLTSMEIPNSVTSIGGSAFSDCSSLTSVEISNSVISIGPSAFYLCSSLTSVVIGNSVTSIGDWAFAYCSRLTSVEIPNSVISIGDGVFSDCSGLTSIAVAEGNPTYDSRDNCNAIIETQTNTLIVGCSETTIPNSVTSIGYFAFEGCSGLTSVVIPNSVTSIGDYAFYDCYGLTKLSCYAKVPPTCGSDVFNGINKETCVLQVPQSCLAAYQQAEQWKEFFFIEDVLSGIGEVTMDGAVPGMADVYSTNGMLIKRNADVKNLKHELPAGIYIIGGKKVLVK